MFGDIGQLTKLVEMLLGNEPLEPIAAQLAQQADPTEFTQGLEQVHASGGMPEAGAQPPGGQVIPPEQMNAQFGPQDVGASLVPIRGGADTPTITPAVETASAPGTPLGALVGGGEDIRNTIGYTGPNPLVPPPEAPPPEDDKLKTALQAWAMMQGNQQRFAPPRAGMPSLGSAGLAQALIPQLYANNPAGRNKLPQVQTLLNQATGGRV